MNQTARIIQQSAHLQTSPETGSINKRKGPRGISEPPPQEGRRERKGKERKRDRKKEKEERKKKKQKERKKGKKRKEDRKKLKLELKGGASFLHMAPLGDATEDCPIRLSARVTP